MRWRDRSDWIRPAGPTHEAIIDPAGWEAVARRFQATARPGTGGEGGRYVPGLAWVPNPGTNVT